MAPYDWTNGSQIRNLMNLCMTVLIDFSGAFIGCSFEGSVIATRMQENSRFYGNPSIRASDILLGSLPRPPAAAVLYHSLSNLFAKLES